VEITCRILNDSVVNTNLSLKLLEKSAFGKVQLKQARESRAPRPSYLMSWQLFLGTKIYF